MKKMIPLLSILLVSSFAIAADPVADAPKGKTHEVTAQVVSVDATAKTLTIKGDAGQPDKTVPCMGGAVDSLKTVKAGDMVTMTCQDNEKGEHQGAIAIKPAAPAKK